MHLSSSFRVQNLLQTMHRVSREKIEEQQIKAIAQDIITFTTRVLDKELKQTSTQQAITSKRTKAKQKPKRTSNTLQQWHIVR
jgi:hypothetical protein